MDRVLGQILNLFCISCIALANFFVFAPVFIFVCGKNLFLYLYLYVDSICFCICICMWIVK